MSKPSSYFHAATVAGLALLLGQPALATDEAVTGQPPPPAVAPTPGEVARAQAEERRAAVQEERNRRYRELRASAAEVGVELPELPPWEAAGAWGPTAAADAAEAYRAQHEQRRQELEARFEGYRQTIERLSDEELEAARAFFGGMPGLTPALPEIPAYAPTYPPNYLPALPGYNPYAYGPRGGYDYPGMGGYEYPGMRGYDYPGMGGYDYPGMGGYELTPRGMARRPLMPYPELPGFDQGPPPPPAADR